MRLLTASALLALSLGCEPSALVVTKDPTPLELDGRTMGTTYSIKFWNSPPGDDIAFQQSLQTDVDRLLTQINDQMSTYLPDSELSRFNSSESDAWFPVSLETAFVVQQALYFNELSGGASDVTVGPLVRLWDFGPTLETDETPLEEPTSEALQAAIERTGCQHLQARLDPPALRKTKARLDVDLSSIAKGYAVDAVAELLLAKDITDFMVEIGGEVRAKGHRPDGRAWRIGVESPIPGERKLMRIVALKNLALASSGDYRNFRRSDGKTYCHIIDPQTGQPLPYRGVAVTVLAETCLEADAIATALLVMGPEKGYPWCEAHDIAALFISRTEEGIAQRASSRFPPEK